MIVFLTSIYQEDTMNQMCSDNEKENLFIVFIFHNNRQIFYWRYKVYWSKLLQAIFSRGQKSFRSDYRFEIQNS